MQELNEYITEEEALQAFLDDINCLDDLLPWTGQFNMFDVLGLSKQEDFHCKMLAWLLDSKESHQLGVKFFRNLMEKLVENAGHERYDQMYIKNMDYTSFQLYRNWENIDIVIRSNIEKMVIAIENKVDSKERDQKLGRLRSQLEKEFPDFEKVYIFISKEGVLLSDLEAWDTMTYGDIETLVELAANETELSSEAALIIRNYKEIIRRDIVDEYQLVEICNRIYQKHKKALDLIFENRMDDKNIVGTIIRETLGDLAQSGRILFDENHKSNTYLMFHTQDMDEYLEPLEESNSSFRTNRVYCYNVIVRDKTLYASFELGGFHATDAHKETMQKILSLHKPNEVLEDGFKFKRVLKTKNFDFTDVSELEPAIRGVVEGFVEELMIMEAQLLFNLDNLDMYVELEDTDSFADEYMTEEGNGVYE